MITPHHLLGGILIQNSCSLLTPKIQPAQVESRDHFEFLAECLGEIALNLAQFSQSRLLMLKGFHYRYWPTFGNALWRLSLIVSAHKLLHEGVQVHGVATWVGGGRVRDLTFTLVYCACAELKGRGIRARHHNCDC